MLSRTLAGYRPTARDVLAKSSIDPQSLRRRQRSDSPAMNSVVRLAAKSVLALTLELRQTLMICLRIHRSTQFALCQRSFPSSVETGAHETASVAITERSWFCVKTTADGRNVDAASNFCCRPQTDDKPHFEMVALVRKAYSGIGCPNSASNADTFLLCLLGIGNRWNAEDIGAKKCRGRPLSRESLGKITRYIHWPPMNMDKRRQEADDRFVRFLNLRTSVFIGGSFIPGQLGHSGTLEARPDFTSAEGWCQLVC